MGHIPQDVIAAAGAVWFPNLKQEIVAYREAGFGNQVAPEIQGDDAEDDLSDNQADATQAAIVLAQSGTIEVQSLPPSDPTAENDALGLPTLDPEEWAKAGGWYRKDFILYYRPVGHEDVVLRTWLDISARSFGTPAERYGDALFQLLADKNTPGKCTKCHSVDQQPGGALEINWGNLSAGGRREPIHQLRSRHPFQRGRRRRLHRLPQAERGHQLSGVPTRSAIPSSSWRILRR